MQNKWLVLLIIILLTVIVRTIDVSSCQHNSGSSLTLGLVMGLK